MQMPGDANGDITAPSRANHVFHIAHLPRPWVRLFGRWPWAGLSSRVHAHS